MTLRDNPEFKALVNKEWKKTRNMSVNNRINLIRSALTNWSNRRYHNSRILTEQKKIELEEEMTDPINYTELRKISKKLNAAYSAEGRTLETAEPTSMAQSGRSKHWFLSCHCKNQNERK